MLVRASVILVLLFLFLFEGTVFQIFAPDLRGADYQLIPRFMFMLILFTGIFRGRSHGLFYGIVLGLLYDIVYSPILGIYTFGMGFTAYLLSISTMYVKNRLPLVVFIIVDGVVMLEYYVYGMMSLLSITDLSHENILTMRFIPSFIMNGVVIAVLAFPLRLWFYYLDGREEAD
ncbi:rod shape-determining protein MreD [Paenalkalicoccus suaedae]|uniref:Rod shape-determining protein MreD n=1 Tax=Paenalkalicoccus suaedae TaxID=2592382 RepID=A0A859FHZ9_9BACI|nr:rod shape-determining protein MreD [Paenalkalicoccus suaedae]QKS71845.1 rod shape-determining protein MreD [Paenalkalicoccus suaedae]